MDQSQERKYSFQTRTFKNCRTNAAYIPGMPTMSVPVNNEFETVAEFVARYNANKNRWEYLARTEKLKDPPITKDNLCELGQLRIPTGVNQHGWIKPSEDLFKERPEIYESWESKIKSFRGGEEVIEAKALSNAFMNDSDSTFIHVTQHYIGPNLYILEPTLRNDPSQPVPPHSGAQQSVQLFADTAGSFLAMPSQTPDFQRHSKLNDGPINPDTLSSIFQSSITNGDSQLSPQSKGNQQIVYPAITTTGSSLVTPVQIHRRRSGSIFSDDPIDPDTLFLIPPQTPPGSSSSSSATLGATTEPFGWWW
ncbi:hypothetical protein BPAE_0245g00090 [Botrytis paeoniae]|uniref:Uncharacterized protein n=1 Tax=Botrytis paeoniae TaxID=278948 RepID=A0A4Z1FCL9_9HELO|nr:hypothetical protein BPAE_0245g00090 [Botrytis paeoniae]